MTNPTFTRSLTALAHPLTLVAVLLLLANDHVFKALWPGWVTGKLGDVVGLAFLPLLLAVPLSLVVPSRLPKHDRWVIGTSVVLAGVWWALAVRVPEVHAASLAVLSVLTASDFYWERDPWDIIALPGLWGAWYAWRASVPVAGAARVRGVMVGGLALVACVATSPAPGANAGVSCVTAEGAYLETLTFAEDTRGSRDSGRSYHRWLSDDGGLNWRAGEPAASDTRCGRPEVRKELVSHGARLRVLPGTRVERFDSDHGSWVTDLELAAWASPGRLFRMPSALRGDRSRPGYPIVFTPPLDAMVDPVSGNLLLAMGHDGLLVRRGDGWVPVSVGPYAQVAPPRITPDLILGELLLAQAVALLAVVVVSGELQRVSSLGLVGLAVILWLYGSLALGGDRGDAPGYAIMRLAPLIVPLTTGLSLLCLALPCYRSFQRVGRMASGWRLLIATGGVAATAFVLPYWLWLEGVIVTYGAAIIASWTLVVLAMMGGLLWRTRSAYAVESD